METGRTVNGDYVVRYTGDRNWTVVDQATYEQAKSGKASLGRSVASGARDVVGGFIEGMASQLPTAGPPIPMSAVRSAFGLEDRGLLSRIRQEARDFRTADDAAQRVRSQQNPIGNFLAESAPAIAGTALMRRPAVMTGAEAAIGSAYTPEQPYVGATAGAVGALMAPYAGRFVSRGARKGASIGRDVIEYSRASRRFDGPDRPAAAAGNTPPRDGPGGAMGAQVNPDTKDYVGRRPLEGLLTSKEADDYGITLTRGERMALNAETGEELARANRLRDIEDTVSSQKVPLLDIETGAVFPPIAKSDQREWLTKRIATELGDPNAETLTPAQRGAIRMEVSKVFKEVIERNEQDIPTGGIVDEVQQLAETAGVNSKPKLTSLAERIAELDKVKVFRKGEFSSLHNSIRRDIDSAFRQGNYELGTALAQVQDALDQALENVLREVDPRLMQDLTEARRQWGILKALERTNAVDPGGLINPRSFYAAYRAIKPSVRTGIAQAKDDEFARILDTINYLTSRQTGDSGTAARIGASILGLGSSAAVAGGAGALGVNILNSFTD